jgi:hypothetical protein
MPLEISYPKQRTSVSALSPGLLDILSPSSEREKDSLLNLDLGQLFQWVLGFSVVNFDLEKGHSLELTYPPIPFSAEERNTLYVLLNRDAKIV